MKNLSAFQKHQITQMVDIDREKLDEVIEAIEYVRAPTTAVVGPKGGPHSSTEWTETRMSGRRKRTVRDGGERSIHYPGTVLKLEP